MKTSAGVLCIALVLIVPARMVLAKGDTHMIIITAAWKAKPGKEAELSKHLKQMVANVKKGEPHCLQYTLHQGFEDMSRFYFYERYTDMKAVELHKTAPHFNQLMASTKDLIAEPVQVGLYEVIE